MKYSLTGHTSGIGFEIYKKLFPNVIGFSRSTGFDITNLESRQKIIALSKNTDVFINNAHSCFDQTLLFLELWQEWKNNPKKIIINVGSRIADVKYLSQDNQHVIKYQAQKILLKEMSHRVFGQCKIGYVSFGHVGTKDLLLKDPDMELNEYITIEQAADLIISKCNELVD